MIFEKSIKVSKWKRIIFLTNCTRSIRQPHAKEEGREGGRKWEGEGKGKGREGKEKRKEERVSICWETILHGSLMYLHILRVRH